MRTNINTLIFLISACFIFLSSNVQANANGCFDFSNKNKSACQAYQYDKLRAHFLDDFSVEQTTVIHRVFNKISGELVHSEYDFEIRCSQQFACTDSDLAVHQVYWALRNAIKESRLYIWVEDLCAPRFSSCCNDFQCTEILGEISGTNEMGSLQNKTARLRIQSLSSAESVSTTLNNVLQSAATMTDFATSVKAQKQNTTLISFIAVEMTADVNLVISVTPNSLSAKPLDGEIRNSGNAELRHEQGYDFNMALHNFVFEFYRGRGMPVCNTSTNCESDGRRCTVIYSCKKPN